ncbi:Crp/Fnr family transcriptional regulator [Bacteroidia bacterium]|nr:Crp/Fnr family transcriptional regulator [Bacteroidia bacterium]
MDEKEEQILDFSGSLHEVWRLLNDAERELLRAHAKVQHYKRNQRIYVEGDEPTHLMCLLEGKVKIYKDGIGGRTQIVRMIKPVQYFAYRAYFAQEKYLTDAAAFEASTICLVPMKVLAQIMHNNFEVCRFFIYQLSVDLGVADERTVSLTQKQIRGRLAESLLLLIDSYGLDENATMNIYLSRDDLANLSNMSSSNAIRTLTSFVSEKIIVLDGRKIKLLDEERLRTISKLG